MAHKPQFPDEQTETGEFHRQPDAFRAWITDDGSTPYGVAAGRYHLYVSLACPWAHRTLIVRRLLRLEAAIGVTVVDPVRDERGWAFREGAGHGADPINGFKFLSEAYVATDPGFRGRWTVPVLWDKHTHRIVNNSEDDICRMLAGSLARLGAPRGDFELFPAEIAVEHAELARAIHDHVNNGVYRAGFASSQGAYERACRALFDMLDELDTRLARQRYLFGEKFVEADWRLFCTLVRFDAVYHGHFKCNIRRIVDYPHLQPYLKDLYQQPGIADTVNFDHIKRHYYITHTELNPSQIVPLGPTLDLASPHGRSGVGATAPRTSTSRRGAESSP